MTGLANHTVYKHQECNTTNVTIIQSLQIYRDRNIPDLIEIAESKYL